MSSAKIPPGGFYTGKDLDFEARIVLGQAGTGIGDVGLVLATLDKMPAQLLGLLNTGQKDAFNEVMASSMASNPEAARTLAFRGKPYGAKDPYDLFKEVEKYQVRDVVGQITTPLLILDPQDEQLYPGQPQQVYDILPGEKKIIEFTREQGANFHCQPLDRHLTATLMLDWLADHVPAPAPSQESQVQS
jgi:hypothetical protein